MEALPESFERTERDSLSHSAHRVKVEVYVMQGVKGARRYFVGYVKVAEISSRVMLTRVTFASGIWRVRVLRKSNLLDRQWSTPSQQLAITTVAGREHTVKEINAAGYALDEIIRHPGTHQIPNPLLW